MPVITKIGVQQKRENRVNVSLDGKFAFGCNKRIVERFELKVGMELTPADLEAISRGELQQKCFDRATLLLSRRMHSRAELKRKLTNPKTGFPEPTVETVLGKLSDLGYLDDTEFARLKLASSQRKLIGARRAMQELRKSGVSQGVAQDAVAEHFDKAEAKDNAQTLIDKNVERLKRLDPLTAKRRLIGLLQRRGFDYETIKPMVDKALGMGRDEFGSEE